MTLEQKIEEFLQIDDVCHDMFHDDYRQNGNYNDPDDIRDSYLNANKITTKSVDHYGGEDQGSTYYTVYSFTDGKETLYVKFSGYYASHYGSEYQEWNYVTPKEKTVIEYV